MATANHAVSIRIRVIIDFMCPWSFIGMRSLQRAKERVLLRQQEVATSGSSDHGRIPTELRFLPIEFVPFEFDPPGTYPPEGIDWKEYCLGYGSPKAEFLLEQKLPRAFALGRDVGIRFKMERRIVDTVDVNTALHLLVSNATQYGNAAAAETFVVDSLSAHFEALENPNERRGLERRMVNSVVSKDAAAEENKAKIILADLGTALNHPEKLTQNQQRTDRARRVLRSGVPQFEVYCDARGFEDLDLCRHPRFTDMSPVSPEYFEQMFDTCLTMAHEQSKGTTHSVGNEDL